MKKEEEVGRFGGVIGFFFGGSCFLGVGLVWSISLLHLERQELGGFGVVIEFGIFFGYLVYTFKLLRRKKKICSILKVQPRTNSSE